MPLDHIPHFERTKFLSFESRYWKIDIVQFSFYLQFKFKTQFGVKVCELFGPGWESKVLCLLQYFSNK